MLDNRGSSVVGEGGGVGVKSDVADGDEEEEKMVPLERPKGLPVLLNLDGLKKRDERSLFS